MPRLLRLLFDLFLRSVYSRRDLVPDLILSRGSAEQRSATLLGIHSITDPRPQDGSLSCRLEREGRTFLPFPKHALANFCEIRIFLHVSAHIC